MAAAMLAETLDNFLTFDGAHSPEVEDVII